MADGFEEIEALTVLDVLRRAEVETVLVSINEDVFVIGAHELNITADTIITDVDFSEFEEFINLIKLNWLNYVLPKQALKNTKN